MTFFHIFGIERNFIKQKFLHPKKHAKNTAILPFRHFTCFKKSVISLTLLQKVCTKYTHFDAPSTLKTLTKTIQKRKFFHFFCNYMSVISLTLFFEYCTHDAPLFLKRPSIIQRIGAKMKFFFASKVSLHERNFIKHFFAKNHQKFTKIASILPLFQKNKNFFCVHFLALFFTYGCT